MSEHSTTTTTGTTSTTPHAGRIDSTTPDARGGNGAAPSGGRPRGARLGTIAVLIGSLLAAAVTRQMAGGFQERHAPSGRKTISSGASLAGMDSYALALLLGGLRGPLVMVLWANSETQKADRNLQGVDTQIEWIRRLQPEFDTVHVFQIWNKAYNLSVQMVGLSNKYTVILDALDYAKSVDAERPDNMNIIKELGRVYSEKLGNSNPEKYFYRERVRRETRYREEASGGAQRGEPGFQRLQHDVLLDESGMILSQYLQPRRTPASDKAAPSGETYDGSELQFLARFQPFPYGVSPHALGYSYQKRTQVLMATQDQKPIQVSESVVDSQPALILKGWAEEEWERARRLEITEANIALPAERIDQELPTASLPLDGPLKGSARRDELLHGYETAARVAEAALAEYDRHLTNPAFATKRLMYGNHIDTLRGLRGMVRGDRDYLAAMTAAGDERAKLLSSASGHYRDAIRDFGLTAIRYFTNDPLASTVLPPGINRANIGTGAPGSLTAVTDEDVLRIMAGIRKLIAERGGPNTDENAEDRNEYETYIRRALERLDQIEKAGAVAAL